MKRDNENEDDDHFTLQELIDEVLVKLRPNQKTKFTGKSSLADLYDAIMLKEEKK